MKHDALTSWHGCGCLSQILSICESITQKDRDALRREASKRRCSVRLIPAGGPMPPWECDEHRAARLAKVAAKAKNTTPSLFGTEA